MLVLLSLNILIDVSELLSRRLDNVRWSGRNFFGTLIVRERDPDEKYWSRLNLIHGTTLHGSQFTSTARNREPTTYYGHQSGIGRAIDYFRKHIPLGQLRLGIVGLGAGTLAAYPEAGDSITFYEIDPVVVQLAENGDWFTYVRDCRARGAHCDIRLGDARLTLQRELAAQQPSPYHILVLDAFSGDSVPVHLLTVEAFELYLKHLATATNRDGKPAQSGALAIHISNRFLNLEPVIRAIAHHFKLIPVVFYTKADPEHDVRAAEWIILTHNAAMAAELRAAATPITTHGEPVLWTDAHSSLFEILR